MKRLETLGGHGFKINAVSAVHFAGDADNALGNGQLPVVERTEVPLGRIAGVHNGICQFKRAFAAFFPVFRNSHACPRLFADTANSGNFSGLVSIKLVDAHHRRHTGTAHNADMVQQVDATGLHQTHIFPQIFFGQGLAGAGLRRAAVVLERPNCRHNHRRVRRKAAVTALEVPEFFVAHFCGKTGFCHMDVAKLQPDPVGNNRTLSQGDIAEGASVHQHGLAFDGLDKVGLDGLHQPGGHGAVHFKIGGGHGSAVAVKGKHHAAHALPQISQIARHGKNGHDL